MRWICSSYGNSSPTPGPTEIALLSSLGPSVLRGTASPRVGPSSDRIADSLASVSPGLRVWRVHYR